MIQTRQKTSDQHNDMQGLGLPGTPQAAAAAGALLACIYGIQAVRAPWLRAACFLIVAATAAWTVLPCWWVLPLVFTRVCQSVLSALALLFILACLAAGPLTAGSIKSQAGGAPSSGPQAPALQMAATFVVAEGGRVGIYVATACILAVWFVVTWYMAAEAFAAAPRQGRECDECDCCARVVTWAALAALVLVAAAAWSC